MTASGQYFIKVHNGFPEHPKTGDLSDRAFRNLIELWCYCSRNLTDGIVVNSQANKILSPKSRRELAAAGYMVEHPNHVEMHDYLEHQQSAQQVADLREHRAEAGKRGGKSTASKRASAQASAQAKPKQTRSKVQADVDRDKDREEPTPTESARPASTALSVIDDKTSQTLMGEWIDNCKAPPPGRVKGQVARELKAMLDEGIPYEQVRRGLAEWNTRDVHPSVLPSIVHGVANRQRASRHQQETDDLFARAAIRMGVAQ